MFQEYDVADANITTRKRPSLIHVYAYVEELFLV